MAPEVIDFISKLLNPIPQYVLGSLPAIAIMGASPKGKFTEKFTWVLRCLGCPFTGLLYSCNVGNDEVKLCIYWLSSKYFTIEVEKEQGEPPQPKQLDHIPVGVYAMLVDKRQENYKDIKTYTNRCTARASVLERLSSLVSIYYIVVGVAAAISRTTGQFGCEDWPYISVLLSWTIPAVFKRAFSGTQVVKDPIDEFPTGTQIIMKPVVTGHEKHKLFTVTLIAFVSIVYPWITVFLAYYTPPVGYYCRSKYLSVFCSIWSFNSFLAYISHLIKEKEVEGKSYLHVWFSIWGFLVAIGLFILALFANNVKWWGIFNEQVCRIAKC